MNKGIIFTLAVLATMNAQAYLFINVTDRGHVVHVDGQAIQNNEKASIGNKKNYKIVVKEDKGKERVRVFTPRDSAKTVIAITFGEVLRRPYAKQYTLEEAKKKYGKRIQF